MDEARPWPAAGEPERIREVGVRRYRNGAWASEADEVAAEEPFEIRVAGQSVAMIMRTPGHDRYLAAGFLVGEGIIATADDVLSITGALDRDGFPQPNVLDLRLRPELESSDRLWQRNFTVTSSCGLCGKASIESARVVAPPVAATATVRTATLLGLEARLRAAQAVFARTGGLHAAGLFDCQGNLVLHHEDVGRHNAVDKIVGQLLLEGRLPVGDALLLVSGRASFELLQKAAIAAIPIFVAVGAPSSLAVEMASDSQITLIGLLRPDRFVVYTHPHRVTSGSFDCCADRAGVESGEPS
jgi:FdhD protein